MRADLIRTVGMRGSRGFQGLSPQVWAFVIFFFAVGGLREVKAQAPDQTASQNELQGNPQAAAPPASFQPQSDGAPVLAPQPETAGKVPAPQEPPAGSKRLSNLPSALPRDLSPWGMFQSADIVVKSVMAGLGLASVVTWTIALAKMIELWGAKRRVIKGLNALACAESLQSAQTQFTHRNTIVSWLINGAIAEAERSGGLSPEGIKERAAALLQRIEARGARLMTRGTGILASIGSTAPFVGLFGTVWGIMNSFVGISQTNTTNLAVVAPGIAEALLATASGLVAAIPAVILYNMLARSIAGYKASLGDATAEVLRHLSRDLDRRDLADDKASWEEIKTRPDWPFAPRQPAE